MDLDFLVGLVFPQTTLASLFLHSRQTLVTAPVTETTLSRAGQGVGATQLRNLGEILHLHQSSGFIEKHETKDQRSLMESVKINQEMETCLIEGGFPLLGVFLRHLQLAPVLDVKVLHHRDDL